MPRKPTLSQSPIKTQSKNKDTHPGIPDWALPHWSSVEVENEHMVKAQAKAAEKEEWKGKIRQAAEFHYTDLANENMFDATPCPSVAPKLWPPPRNRKQANLVPVAEVSGNSDDDNDMDTLSLKLTNSKESTTKEELAAEIDPRPPAKRLKAQTTEKDILKVHCAAPAKKKWKAALCAEEMVPALNEVVALASDEELSQNPKKNKFKVWDEINVATKKFEEGEMWKSGDIAELTSGQQAGDEWSGTPPAPQTPLQVPGRGRRGLKRSGAIANIKVNMSHQQLEQLGPDQSSNNPIR